MGEVLVYEIMAKGRKVLHMGSLNMDASEDYPQGVAVMTVPFQGRSDLSGYALQFVRRVKPACLYLHHFDDTFPPISRTVDTRRFVENIRRDFPEMKVVIPRYGEEFSF